MLASPGRLPNPSCSLATPELFVASTMGVFCAGSKGKGIARVFMVDPTTYVVRVNGISRKLKTGSKTVIDFGSINLNSSLGTGISFLIGRIFTVSEGLNRNGAMRITGCKQLEPRLGGKGLKVLTVQGEEDGGCILMP